MYTVSTTEYFIRASRKFFRKHPELEKPFCSIFDALSEDPFQPHLKLHPLKGVLKGVYAISLSYSYRITLTLQLSKNNIILLDIGSHDEVY